MKKFIKNIAIVFIAAFALVPALASADYDYYEYGSTDFYDYTDSYSYGSTDFNDYTSYYDYGSTDFYDYSDSYSYGSTDFYDYTDTYSYGSTDFYDYVDYYEYGSTDFYDYEDYAWYDENDNFEGYYEDEYYYEDYYGYYNDYSYNPGSNCGSNCYTPRPQPCRTNCNPPQPPVQDLNVICIPSDRTVEVGESVTFEAEVDGGRSPYTYRWTGDFTSSSRIVTVRFDDEGTYRATVRVTDSRGRTDTAECEVRVEEDEDEDFDAVCVPARTTVDRNERVTLEARVDGGHRPYDYDWSGDADGDDDEITVRFSREGTYEIDLKVTDDDGRVARDTCTVRVRDNEDDDDRDINVTTGTIPYVPPSIGSVYLNQVPYTGPEDVAKGIAFVGILLAWSVAGAMILRKKKAKGEVANRVAAFKEANKLAKA